MNYKDTTAYSPLEASEKDLEGLTSLLSDDSSDEQRKPNEYYPSQRSGKKIWKIVGLVLATVGALLLSFLLGWTLQPSWNEKCIDTQWGMFSIFSTSMRVDH